MNNISEISISNILGRALQTIKVNEDNTKINISNFARGMYFIEFKNIDGSRSVKNFVKE